jgi:hypothetical protein
MEEQESAKFEKRLRMLNSESQDGRNGGVAADEEDSWDRASNATVTTMNREERRLRRVRFAENGQPPEEQGIDEDATPTQGEWPTSLLPGVV